MLHVFWLYFMSKLVDFIDTVTFIKTSTTNNKSMYYIFENIFPL